MSNNKIVGISSEEAAFSKSPKEQAAAGWRPKSLQEQLVTLINKHGREDKSNTPDFILAEYLMDCLLVFESATNKRTNWHSKK